MIKIQRVGSTKSKRIIIIILLLLGLVLSGCLKSNQTLEERELVKDYNEFSKQITNEQNKLMKIQNEWENLIQLTGEDNNVTREEKIKLSEIRHKYVAECDQTMSQLKRFTEFLQQNAG